jgi:hypothetical protein
MLYINIFLHSREIACACVTLKAVFGLLFSSSFAYLAFAHLQMKSVYQWLPVARSKVYALYKHFFLHSREIACPCVTREDVFGCCCQGPLLT